MFSFRVNAGEPLSLARRKGFRRGFVVFKATWIQKVVLERPWRRNSAAFDAGGLKRRRLLLGDQILAMFESVMEVATHLVMQPLVGSLSVPSLAEE
jgi:hypothetical protein